MRRFADLPLKHKLTLLSLLTSTVALVLASVGFAAYEQLAFKRDLIARLATTAEMIGFNSASSLSFDDPRSATQTLHGLSAQPSIVAACIYAADGGVFATYPSGLATEAFGPRPASNLERFEGNHVELSRPIALSGDTIGTIYLRADTREIQARLYRYALIGGSVMLVAMLAAWWLAARLQRVISSPLAELAAIAGQVAADRNYAVRASRRGRDEIGRLIDGFNEMLAQIQTRDSALDAARRDLEQRVAERTARLAEASGLLEAMLENSPDFIYFKDRSSRFVRFSNACLQRQGLTEPAQMRGKTDADFFGAEHAKPAYADEQEIIRTGQPIVGKLEKETYPDRPPTWVLTTKMPWRDGSGAIVGTFGISKDVTLSKDAEDKLAYERDQLRSLLDSSPDAIYFKDLQSRFVRVSHSKVLKTIERTPNLRALRAERGLPPDVPEPELLNGLTDFDAYQSDDAKLAFEDEQAIIRTGQGIIGKVEKQNYVDGTVRWRVTSKMPWRDRVGTIIGTFGISKDITDLKETEEKLERMHRQLLETSRQAGMAEVATGVLHNVGNVLNSVNVSATLVSDHLRHSKAGNIAKLSVLFEQNKASLPEFLTRDPRGQMIPGYLATLAEALAVEQKTITVELESLRKNVEHIKEIVAMQQAYARTSGVTETVGVVDMLEDALRINAGSLARHDVDVVRDYHARPVVTTDKHKVVQILINLVRNAKYACDESGRNDKMITVRTTSDERSVTIAVIDNGVGIPPENLTRIFNHGFTTRQHGHGFGLHSGALAAKELGGALNVQSDGPGRGAAFTLLLPFKTDSA